MGKGFTGNRRDLDRQFVRILRSRLCSRVAQRFKAHSGLANVHIDLIDLLNDGKRCRCRGRGKPAFAHERLANDAADGTA